MIRNQEIMMVLFQLKVTVCADINDYEEEYLTKQIEAMTRIGKTRIAIRMGMTT